MAQQDLLCLKDYEDKALSMLDSRYGDFFATGADDEQTLGDDERDFKRLRLRPRMMVDVSNVSLRTTILGNEIAFPIGVAPSSEHKLAHPEGDVGTARAAEKMRTCFCLSTSANTSAHEIGEKVPDGLKWFQLYFYKSREVGKTLIRRAEKAGFKAIVITIDLPVCGNRRRSNRNKYELPPHVRVANLEGLVEDIGDIHLTVMDSLTWEDMKWITSFTSLPVIAKGVLTGHDAQEAIKAGCSAVYVSSHGGRQLDGVYSSITALSEVVKAVAGRVEVYMDGGVRTGTDVLKALAFGARTVFIGRPIIYGLAVGGEDGVRRVLTILRNELKLAMQLSGVTDVTKIPRELVIHESMVSRI